MGPAAFTHCRKLHQVELNEGLERIGVHAFSFCGFVRLELPESVRTVGPLAFMGCERLHSVRLNEGLEELGPEEKFYR